MTDAQLSRRTALIAVGGSTLALCLGCSTAPSSAGASGGGAVTIKAAEVPVGSGKIVGQFVVTQPTAGKFEAFGYLCTHQNLPVQEVSNTAIVCGRHGSSYSLTDGSVLTGPATRGLSKATVAVSGDSITVS
jgi:nitrite reductase/ring-hydroxylating ferredoxin subunit